MIQVDFHIHTKYSPDATIAPKTLIDQLHAHPTIKTIAVTDHNTLKGYSRTCEFAAAYRDLLIIPGAEISAIEGELIILGITELPPKPWTANNVIAFARENDGLVIVPHPYRGCGLGEATRNCDVDAIEVLNGITENKCNRLAENLAKEMNLPGVAGSDSHEVADLWSVYTEVDASSSVEDILEAVKRGSVRVFSAKGSIRF